MLQLWFISNTLLWDMSIGSGVMRLSLGVSVLLFAGAVWIAVRGKIKARSAKALLALFGFSIFSFVVATCGVCTDHLSKAFITLPILLFLVLVGLEVGCRSESSDWLNLQRTSWWCLILVFFTFMIEILIPSWFPHRGSGTVGKLSGLFSEPSHVAFSLFPCVAILLIAEDKRTRQRGILAIVGLLVLSRSSTLVALLVAFLVYRSVVHGKIHQAAAVAAGMAVLVVLAAVVDYNQFLVPTIDRVVGVAASSDTNNISSLVYVQGWQDAWYNLRKTHGAGLGLNMMGCSPLPDVPARGVLSLEGLGELNAQDGSFLFSKIVSEIGLVGIVFYIAIICWWIQLERKIRRLSAAPLRFAASVQAVLIFCFVTSSFIRGAGYFSGGLLLWVSAVSGGSNWSEELRELPAEAFAIPKGKQQTKVEYGR